MGEFVEVSENWLVGELICPTLPRQIGRYFYFSDHEQCRVDHFLLWPPPPPHFIFTYVLSYSVQVFYIYIYIFLIFSY